MISEKETMNRSRGYKFVFLLTSTEHGILTAHTCKNFMLNKNLRCCNYHAHTSKCYNTKVQLSQKFERKIAIIFLPISCNICFGCSKEPSR